MTRARATARRNVRYTVRRGVAWLEVALRQRADRVDYDTACALVEAAEELEWCSEARVVVLQTDGRNFCLGSEREDRWPAPVDWVEAIARLSVPVIAAVHGGAVSEGCELALACDLRWVRQDAYFVLAHLVEGRFPHHGGTQRLSRVVGRMRALELLWTARRIAAREALRIGLATRDFTLAHWPAALKQAAREMARLAPLALRYGKEAVTKGADLPLAHGLRMEEDLYVLLQSTADREEGIRCFLEHRKPRFRGC